MERADGTDLEEKVRENGTFVVTIRRCIYWSAGVRQ